MVWLTAVPQIPSLAKPKEWAGLRLTTDGERRLVPDIFGGGRVDGVFRDVGGVIADPFEMTRDEHQIQVTAQLFRVLRHPLDQAPAGTGF
ncbi:MAG: hypothetical protein M3R59_07690 [Verrucomicrobiota bacterium]|nr:hypothetical protein [Verrucomicrobiota bacterium]